METMDQSASQRENWPLVLEWIGGMIVAPTRTLREVCAREAWLPALAIVAGIGLLEGLVQGAHLLAGLTPGFEELVGGPLEELTPTFRLAGSVGALSTVLWQPVSLLMFTVIYYLIAYLLGGRGRFMSLIATLGFAQVPSLLAIPFSTLPLLATVSSGLGLLGTLVSGLVGLAVGIWTFVLSILGVREAMGLSTGRAVLTVLIPVLVLLAFIALIICVLLVFFVTAAGTLTEP